MADPAARMDANAPAADYQASASRSANLSADFQTALSEANTGSAGNAPLFANSEASADKPGQSDQFRQWHPETPAELDAMWDNRARKAIDKYGQARLPEVREPHAHPGEPTTEKGPKWHQFSNEMDDLSTEYREEFSHQTPSTESQKEYIDKALDIINQYENNPDAPLSDREQKSLDSKRDFLEAQKRVLDERSAVVPGKAVPLDPNLIATANTGDGVGYSDEME